MTTKDKLAACEIGYYKGTDDQSALAFRQGNRVIGIIHGELADVIYSMIPEAKQRNVSEDVRDAVESK